MEVKGKKSRLKEHIMCKRLRDERKHWTFGRKNALWITTNSAKDDRKRGKEDYFQILKS